MQADSAERTSTVDPAELRKFERMAAEWWDPDGKFKPLHRFNPARLAYLRDIVCRHLSRDPSGVRPFDGLSILDIGCGGGVLSEPMTRLGGAVVGIDPAAANIEVARLHAERSGLRIDYRVATAEALAEEPARFDVVLAMEVVEHVTDIDAFLATAGSLLRPGGLIVVATINRTLKAFALAIVGAEYVLRWLPRGTHDYAKLVRPSELAESLQAAGLEVIDRAGLRYDPLRDNWERTADLSVNYMVAAERRNSTTAS